MTPRVVAIVQARMGSLRLPGKVLLGIGGQPMLARVVVRVSRSRAVHEVLVATTTDPSDDQLAQYCRAGSINCTRGSQFDVLDRYFQAARQVKADIIVRITADCPVIDPGLIADAVDTLMGDPKGTAGNTMSLPMASIDFVTNRLPPPWRRTYPIGLDTEVCTVAALERAWQEAKEPQEREHVMPYFYEGVRLSQGSARIAVGSSPRGFRMALLNYEKDLGTYRWTVDTPEDMVFMRQVYGHFGGRDDFTWKDVLELVQSRPELMRINARVKHKSLSDIDERNTGTQGP